MRGLLRTVALVGVLSLSIWAGTAKEAYALSSWCDDIFYTPCSPGDRGVWVPCWMAPSEHGGCLCDGEYYSYCQGFP